MHPQPAKQPKVADEAWIATAVLHREQPAAEDFPVEEIREKAKALGFTRPGVYVHIVQGDVANRPPNPGRYRMLFETAPGRRRLYRPGDPFDQHRDGSKMLPQASDLPSEWRNLLDWYGTWVKKKKPRSGGLLSLIGSGRKIWADEHADEYIERLRSDWE